MTAIVNTNLASLGARAQLARSQGSQVKSIARLASGLRVNGASDDAAGLAIADRLASRIRGLNVAARNTQDGISMLQTADGGLGSIGANLQRLRELAVQAANASNSGSDRAALQAEAAQLVAEIDRVAVQTKFNGSALLDGTLANQTFQVGPGTGADQRITLSGLAGARVDVLGLTAGAALPPVVATSVSHASGLNGGGTITGPGQLVVNGVDVYQGSPIAADALQIAAAINAAGISGVSAAADPLTLVGAWTAAPSPPPGGMVYAMVQGLGFGLPVNGDRSNDIGYDAFLTHLMLSLYAPGTDVADNGDGVTFTTDGRNLTLGVSYQGDNFSFAPPAWLGWGGIPTGAAWSVATSYSTYSISYTGSDGLSIQGTNLANLGLTALTPPPPATGAGSALAQLDLSTVGGANAALASLDLAIDSVDRQRATLGAAENRFSSVIGDVRTEAQNSAASRGRIVDADYAIETMRLVRSQILQDAGLAMVAQANVLQSNVLELLR